MDHPPPRDGDGERWDQWARLVDEVADHFEGHDGDLDAIDLAWLNEHRDVRLEIFDIAHALAWGIDEVSWHKYPDAWLSVLGWPTRHRVSEGEYYPVSDWLPSPPEGGHYSVRPGAEATVGPDELPHVRKWSSHTSASGEPVDLIFHFSAWAQVKVIGEDRTIVTIHPNRNDYRPKGGEDPEFEVGGDDRSIYPVRPCQGDQADRVVALLEEANSRGPSLIVGGELSLTENVLERVRAWLGEEDELLRPALIVPGSIHENEGDLQRNIAYAMRAGQDPLVHRKIAPFEQSVSRSKKSIREDIAPGPRELHVWVGDWARFAMLICRDLLDRGIRAAVERAGVNLLAVPAFSNEMSSYPVHVGSVSLATQGRVVVANNPTHHGGLRIEPTAVFGQPLEKRLSMPVNCDERGPGRGIAVDVLGVDPEWVDVGEI